MVDGFRGTFKKPISPAVIINGNKLGISDTKIIFKLRNIQAINIAMSKMAIDNEIKRLFIKNFVPF